MKPAYPPFNPAQSLRNRGSEQVNQVEQRLQAATLAQLRTLNADLFAKYPDDAVVAIIWAVNNEFTRRGIGPRWRAVESHFVPPRTAATIPHHLIGIAPVVRPWDETRKLLLRWIDLAWLRCELGPSHFPRASWYHGIFDPNAEPSDAEQAMSVAAESAYDSHDLVRQLSIPRPHLLAVAAYRIGKAIERVKTINKKLKKVVPAIERHGLRDRYPMTPDQVAQRVAWAEAIELAEGRPTEAALFLRWITGQKVTPQAAERMRHKLAADLALKGRSWNFDSSRERDWAFENPQFGRLSRPTLPYTRVGPGG